MAFIAADRDLLITTMFEIAGEDCGTMGRMIAKLELRFPAVAWRSRMVTLARLHQPFINAKLSIDWWTTEAARYADVK